jgi:hypothetical protein
MPCAQSRMMILFFSSPAGAMGRPRPAKMILFITGGGRDGLRGRVMLMSVGQVYNLN